MIETGYFLTIGIIFHPQIDLPLGFGPLIILVQQAESELIEKTTATGSGDV